MLELSLSEMIVFTLILAAQAAAGAIVTRQLLGRRGRAEAVVAPVILAGIAAEGLLLVMRGVSIHAVPLTGPFESLLLLALIFGVSYLFLRRMIDQVWFGLVMVWLMFGTVVAAGFVAGPPSQAQRVAATPWAIAHGVAMILAAASVVLATAASILYLLAHRRLKHKKVMHVLGRIPNMETLVVMNRIGLRLGFVLLTAGVAGGLGLASSLGTGLGAWLADGKVLCILAAWALLGAILVWDRFFLLRGKIRAYVTIATFALILFATIGVTVFGTTQHKFSWRRPPMNTFLAT